jgi:hypothetical protein
MAAVPAAENELREATATLKPDYQQARWARDWVWEPEPTEPLPLVEALAAAQRREVEASAAREGIRAELRAAEARRKSLVEATDRAAWAVIAKHAADINLAEEVDRLQRAAFDAGLRLALLHKAGVISAKKETLNRVEAYQGFWDLDDLQGGRSWSVAHRFRHPCPAGLVGIPWPGACVVEQA